MASFTAWSVQSEGASGMKADDDTAIGLFFRGRSLANSSRRDVEAWVRLR
jgi:hypothetical protein